MTPEEMKSLLNALVVCLLRSRQANVTLLLPLVMEQAESWWPSPDFGLRVDALLTELGTSPDSARAFVAPEDAATQAAERVICEYANRLEVRCIDGVIHDQWGPLPRTCPVCLGHGRSK